MSVQASRMATLEIKSVFNNKNRESVFMGMGTYIFYKFMMYFCIVLHCLGLLNILLLQRGTLSTGVFFHGLFQVCAALQHFPIFIFILHLVFIVHLLL